jgi:hypothetical protein
MIQMTMYNNTTSYNYTHFPMAASLIIEARKKFNIGSEDWSYPTDHRIGYAGDSYYAEVWYDGMDWTKNFWVVETCKYNNPSVLPLMVFDEINNYSKFNKYDFKELVSALLSVRRDNLWLHLKDYDRYNDIAWPYLHILKKELVESGLMECYYEHGSQEHVEFLLNPVFLPPRDKYIMEGPNKTKGNGL